MDSRITVRIQVFADRPALQLQWTDETGRRRTRSAKTADPERAERARADLEYELNHGLHRPRARTSWEAFRELLEREYLPGRRPETARNYRDTLDCVEDLARPASLASLSTRSISAFVAAMRTDRGFQPSTIRVRLEFLRAALGWAHEQGLLAEVPRFPTISVPRKRPQPVPAEAFERLLAKVDAAGDVGMRAYVLCGWLAGMRRNEAYYLEWEPTEEACWVDLEADRIRFPAEAVKAKEDQWVPLAAELRQALLALPRTEGRRVFDFGAGPNAVVKRLQGYAKRAGVLMSMRTLRRGFGCRHAGRVPAQVLQRLMRHSSIGVTMSYYANVDAAVEEAVRLDGNSCGNSDEAARENARQKAGRTR